MNKLTRQDVLNRPGLQENYRLATKDDLFSETINLATVNNGKIEMGLSIQITKVNTATEEFKFSLGGIKSTSPFTDLGDSPLPNGKTVIFLVKK